MIQFLRQVFKDFFWIIIVEAMQSGFHFALNITLMQIMTAYDYGVFAIVMVIGGLGLTYIRALAGMPVSIFIGRSHSKRQANAIDVTFGSGALLLSIWLGLATALTLQLWTGANAVISGAFVSLWCMRSYLRAVMFARALQKKIILSDCAFTFSGVIFAAVLLLLDHPSDKLQTGFLVLAIANAVGLATALTLGRNKLRIDFGHNVARRYTGLRLQLFWSAVSVTTSNLQGQGLSLLVVTIAGPAAYAPIAAGLVLFVPLRIAASALANMMQPGIARLVKRGDNARMWQQVQAWTALMAIGSVAYGSIMMLILPHLKNKVFQATPIYVIGVSCWAIYAATATYVMPRLMLEAANRFRTIAIITACGAIIGMLFVTCLLWIAPASWSLLGALISELIVLGACWISVIRMFPIGITHPLPIAN